MAQEKSKVFRKSLEDLEMHFSAQAMADGEKGATLIKHVIPREHRTVKEWVRDTYYRLRKDDGRWSYSRTENIWYEFARRIDAWEMDSLRRVIEISERERQDAAIQLTEARAEFDELRSRYHRQKQSMGHTDADFFGPQLDALALKVARFIAPEIEGE